MNQVKFKAAELRDMEANEQIKKNIKKNPVYIIVDNVLDTYNIGSIFRLAEATAVTKVYLCGATETPPHTRIKKASINTTEWVDWEYASNALDAISNLKSQIPNIQIVSIELDSRSKPYTEIPYTFPVALIVGHETTGVTQEVLAASDYIAELPMWGINTSLNVIVSLGIVLYKVMEKSLP